jgi:hypothetical protein
VCSLRKRRSKLRYLFFQSYLAFCNSHVSLGLKPILEIWKFCNFVVVAVVVVVKRNQRFSVMVALRQDT